ncbi:hypothetical protein J8Z24_05185 [Pseudoalteromonas sp. SCSIO 43201]|uniref:hypothetical protein n=1 Tax=Pseudoalteromonas sp. SCSIO 43201 TaxID=2822842 RepID=UPI00207517A6|nr:hypothetical protein [Pseudoalteromonas sp. SCSIO 43201]USD29480.1 hypothetical protein J8Z24_05185 [Pseudoalteromonas sp. SCSIO 43201]
MALTDWGNTSDLNQGGFKDGVFQGSQSQLLPWPERTRPDFAPSLFFRGRAVIPNPYDEAKGYVLISFDRIDYYNSDGTIKWTVSRYDIYNQSFMFGNESKNHIIHTINGIPHLIGYSYCDDGKCFYSINLESADVIRGPWLDSHSIRLGILDDGRLFSVTGVAPDVYTCFIVDELTLTKTVEIEGCGYINRLRVRRASNQPTYRAFDGISLLGGNVTLLDNSTGEFDFDQTSYCFLFFGINANCDFSKSSDKALIRTAHHHAINTFNHIVQISRDLFACMGSMPSVHLSEGQTNTLFFTRKELEDWASDVIYSAHDIRIPKQA